MQGGATQYNTWIPIACPPGLEYLAQIDQVYIKQQVETLEVVTGMHTENRYEIRNSAGQLFMFAREESDENERLCCPNSRGFILHITDNNGLELLRYKKEFAYCDNQMTVETPMGQVLGKVGAGEDEGCCDPKLRVTDEQGQFILYIKTEDAGCLYCCGDCTSTAEFQIQTPDKTHNIGSINKIKQDITTEWLTNADTFMLTFPIDLDVKAKATLIGAAFLVEDAGDVEDTPKDQVVGEAAITVGVIIAMHQILPLTTLQAVLRREQHATRAENWDILNEHVEELGGVLTNGEDEDESA
ncbi:phospholipid scramblase 1-like [Symsagittifera roscoffensis]|uniref:phospholipid scramblase 1-like n=1 Tax=Symsagittifera roscoffensis TaxID=84072 RepID=UPI00307B2AD1